MRVLCYPETVTNESRESFVKDLVDLVKGRIGYYLRFVKIIRTVVGKLKLCSLEHFVARYLAEFLKYHPRRFHTERTVHAYKCYELL